MREKSAIGLSFICSSLGFPGLRRGITRPRFQNFGIFALFTEKFMASVRYFKAMGPRWFEWIGAILSGPSALLFFVSCIASFTVLHFNILSTISSFFIVLNVFLFCFSFFLQCGVYCWLKLLAHLLLSWWGVIFLASKIWRFAGGLALLERSSFTVLQSLEQSPLWVGVYTSSIQFLRFWLWTICLFHGLVALFWGPWIFSLNLILFKKIYCSGKIGNHCIHSSVWDMPASGCCVYGFP